MLKRLGAAFKALIVSASVAVCATKLKGLVLASSSVLGYMLFFSLLPTTATTATTTTISLSQVDPTTHVLPFSEPRAGAAFMTHVAQILTL